MGSLLLSVSMARWLSSPTFVRCFQPTRPLVGPPESHP